MWFKSRGSCRGVMNMETEYQDGQKRLLILTISLYLLNVFFIWVIDPWILTSCGIYPFYSQVIFNIICLMFFTLTPDCNPYGWAKELLQKKKAKNPKYALGRNIAIALSLLAIAVKAIGAHYFNYLADDAQPHSMYNFPLDIFVFLLGGFAEEALCKGGMFRALIQLRIPRIVAMILVSALFALMHFNFNPLILAIYFLFQMFFLFVFTLYPSMLFVSFMHAAWNLSMFV